MYISTKKKSIKCMFVKFSPIVSSSSLSQYVLQNKVANNFHQWDGLCGFCMQLVMLFYACWMPELKFLQFVQKNEKGDFYFEQF